MLSLFVGTSYAILKGIDTTDSEQIIKTGSVKLKLTEKFDSIDKKITVMSDVDGLMQETTYDFNLKNIGSEPAKFDMKLVNEVPSSYTGEVLSLDYFKVGLEINGEEHGPMSLEDVKGIIDSDVIYEKELINYKLRIWLDEEKSEELKTKEDYKAFLKLEVEASQRVEEMDTLENVTTFSYTGDVQEYRIPRDGYYKIEAWGAQGGSYNTTYSGGHGAYTSGEIYLESGEKLYIYVGGKGVASNSTGAKGGYNGGGDSYAISTDYYMYSGGGSTDIRLVSGNWDDIKSLRSRIMVAGAGGGAGAFASRGNYGKGGAAGGLTAYVPTLTNCSSCGATFTATTQTSGGVGRYGTGGFGYGVGSTTSYSCGGGSGYYGGAGDSYEWGAIGGTSYISGHTGCVAVTSQDDTTPKSGCTTGTSDNNCSIHYSNKKFINTVMIDGSGYAWTNTKKGLQKMPSSSEIDKYYENGIGQSENGVARITYLTSQDEKNFDYTNDVQEYIIPKSGLYRLETWGAQGGGYNSTTYRGGYGGYSSGEMYFKRGEKLYIYVGGSGTNTTSMTAATAPGGYNGGGKAVGYTDKYVGSGGGATHIATASGLLSELSNNKNSILIVAGGGGGGAYQSTTYYSTGGDAGGYIGNSGLSTNSAVIVGSGGKQDTAGTGVEAGSFGQGGNVASNGNGGGGGYYGGGTGQYYNGGGGGSGYINTNKLSNAYMFCYNCSTSTDESTYTSKTTNISTVPLSNNVKTGHGYARITYLGIDREIDYTNKGYEFKIQKTGTYKLEVWGAQGGGYNTSTYRGGYGSYSTGESNLKEGDKLYIYVGGAGTNTTSMTAATAPGGFNGGGTAVGYTDKYVGSGGGATHIATTSGLLSTLSDKRENILIVAGGGGGGSYQTTTLYSNGGDAGGYIGNTGLSTETSYKVGTGGNQDTAGTGVETGSFGQGGNVASNGNAGGGGYYGGGTGQYFNGGGGGSGYINITKLFDAFMYCYNCATSSESLTKTYSTTNVSNDALKNSAKLQNGYARITFLK